MSITIKTKAIIFDMDGVITNTMPDHYKAWKTVFAEEGLQLSHADIYSREGQPGINSVKELFALNGIPFNQRKAKHILKRKEDLFKKIVKPRFIRGSRRFLHQCAQDLFQLALVTGTSRHELHRILPNHLYELFDVVVAGNDVKKGKPHPEPFFKAIRKLQIKPSQGIVIENAPFGIQSAQSAGLKCCAICTSLPKSFLKKADHIFDDMHQLQRQVRFVNVCA